MSASVIFHHAVRVKKKTKKEQTAERQEDKNKNLILHATLITKIMSLCPY